MGESNQLSMSKIQCRTKFFTQIKCRRKYKILLAILILHPVKNFTQYYLTFFFQFLAFDDISMLSGGLTNMDLSKLELIELVPKEDEEPAEVVIPQVPIPDVPSDTTTTQNTTEQELIPINEQFLNSEIPDLNSDLLRTDNF